jgi:hypothetical protein
MIRMPQGNLLEHLQLVLSLLKTNSPFCLIRPSDGEYMVLQGMNFKNIDNWHFNGEGKLKHDLHFAIQKATHMSNTFIGIPCSCCNHSIELWYKKTYALTKENTTYANIVCNASWQVFTDYLISEKVPFYYIGPKPSTSSFPLQICDIFSIPEYLVNSYDTEAEGYFSRLVQWVDANPGPFFFSCGPISKIWSVMLFELFPSKVFLDVGSALDIFLKGTTNRQYCYSNQPFARRICYFQDT